MKIDAITNNGQQLINAINKALNEGALKTWKRVQGADDSMLYTHTPEQWNEVVIIKADVFGAKVQFDMAWWNNRPEPSQEIKGYVTGRFTEVLMVHFRNYFTKLETIA